jgi:putative addiction module killer protein
MLPMNTLELVVYQDVRRWQPFEAWFECLDIHAAQKVTAALQRMAEGNLSDSRSVGAGVIERRINWGQGYRVYFGRDGDHLVVLLGGGTKQQQLRDIEEAQSRWADYKRRKKQLAQSGGGAS